MVVVVADLVGEVGIFMVLVFCECVAVVELADGKNSEAQFLRFLRFFISAWWWSSVAVVAAGSPTTADEGASCEASAPRHRLPRILLTRQWVVV